MKKILLPALILLTSCFINPNRRSDEVLARVYKEYLYASELKGIIPPGTDPRDSISLVQNYVNNWVSRNLFLYKAKRNLRPEDMNFDKQLNEYRNSLIVYQYESKLVNQNLDTVVSESEIESYYNENIGNFQLKDNIVKAYYARFNENDPHLARIKKFFYSERPEYRDSLNKYIENYSDFYYLDDETWILFDDVLKFVPIKTYNEEAYLQNHRQIEVTEDPYIYFLNFSDFKIKEGVSPLSFEKDNIVQIILNKRKLEIISKMREEVFQTALKNNDFEIF